MPLAFALDFLLPRVWGEAAYSLKDYVWIFQNFIPPKGTRKLLKKWRGPFMITEVHQEGRFYRLSTGRAAHYENIKPHNLSTEDWCIPADMEEGDYLMMDPACEVNSKVTRTWIRTRWLKRMKKPDPTQKRTSKTPNRCRPLKIWNQSFRLPYRLNRLTGQESRRNTILTEMTS